MVYSYNEMPWDIEDERQPFTMNVTNSVEQKILDTKEYLMYDSIYMKFKNKQNYL